MTSAVAQGRTRGQGRSIGQVLALLQEDFPDVSISKIRFLETEGLVRPSRSASGYRQFSDDDVQVLTTVLTAQRDQYLPLRVIRERLAQADSDTTATADDAPEPGPPALGDLASDAPDHARLTRHELARFAGLDMSQLDELEAAGLVRAVEGSRLFDGHALAAARAARSLGRFGLEPRHLRVVRSAADRQSALVEQVVAPLRGQRSTGAPERAEATAREVARLCLALHAALLRSAPPSP